MNDHATAVEKSDLINWIAAGEKPTEQWRLGTEHEKFGFELDSLRPMTYEGEKGIRRMLEGFAAFGWQPIMEHDHPIGMKKSGCSITLEPGGQLELSGAPLSNVHQTCNEVHSHLKEVKMIADRLGVGFVGLGFQPKWRRQDIPWMPKDRYVIMRNYMPKVGTLGHDMMLRTCTVQVNLDFSSEADMIKKFRTSLALQPIATALFANSPFVEGKPSGYLSYRAHVWTDTDPNRSGMLPFVFESGMSYERYVDYMLDVPMYFVRRNGEYLDAAGLSFRDFMDGKLSILPGQRPSMTDWEDHTTTAFPEVRLKQFLEMRGADGGPWHRLCALPALWVGLLYDDAALEAAWDIARDWTAQQREQLRLDVMRHGLNATIGNKRVQDLARDVLEIASEGLSNRQQLSSSGDDESGFLTPLKEIVESGVTPAERKLRDFETRWQGNIDHIFHECAY
ncbi:MAG: glutamate--cysteine ligase [Lysobacteraceae bacterium]|nr:MAG: glutamate--cysteine ligase [Xanthomonadaceae bacterium]